MWPRGSQQESKFTFGVNKKIVCVQQKNLVNFHNVVTIFLEFSFFLNYKFEKSALNYYYYYKLFKNMSNFWKEKKTHVWVPWDDNDQQKFYKLIVLLMHFITYLHALISLLNIET
jgi:hypothetical protein